MHRGCLYYEVTPDNGCFDYPPCIVNLRSEICYQEDDIGRFAIAVRTYTPFFLAPNGSVWCNGLDGVRLLSECLALFDDKDSAREAIRRKKFFSDEDMAQLHILCPEIIVYVVKKDVNGDVCLSLCL